LHSEGSGIAISLVERSAHAEIFPSNHFTGRAKRARRDIPEQPLPRHRARIQKKTENFWDVATSVSMMIIQRVTYD